MRKIFGTYLILYFEVGLPFCFKMADKEDNSFPVVFFSTGTKRGFVFVNSSCTFGSISIFE